METWKQIKDFPYEVSDLGKVKSTKSGLVLKDRLKTSMKYRCVVLYNKGSKREVKVSVLVLETFVGPKPKGQVCCHLNGNSQDDRLANLEWNTQSKNILDKFKHGTHSYNDVNIKLTNTKTGETFVGKQRPLSKLLGLHQSGIWKVCNKLQKQTRGFTGEYIVVTEGE